MTADRLTKGTKVRVTNPDRIEHGMLGTVVKVNYRYAQPQATVAFQSAPERGKPEAFDSIFAVELELTTELYTARERAFHKVLGTQLSLRSQLGYLRRKPAQVAKSLRDAAGEIEGRLARLDYEVERAGGPAGLQRDWGMSPTMSLAHDTMHTVQWMTPNLHLEELIRLAAEFEEAQRNAAAAAATFAAEFGLYTPEEEAQLASRLLG